LALRKVNPGEKVKKGGGDMKSLNEFQKEFIQNKKSLRKVIFEKKIKIFISKSIPIYKRKNLQGL